MGSRWGVSRYRSRQASIRFFWLPGLSAFRTNAAQWALGSSAPDILCFRSVRRCLAPKFGPPRHAAFVRVTHWITVICFFALLISGVEILISHPRFYWGETGNVLTRPLFQIPIPSSRSMVPTGYGYVLPDQNGWGRDPHFRPAWAAVLTGLVYTIWGLWSGHVRSNLFPAPADRTWGAYLGVIAKHMHLGRPDKAEAFSYNVLQRTAYLMVILVLLPLVIWTGLAMSPAFNSRFQRPSMCWEGGNPRAPFISSSPHFYCSSSSSTSRWLFWPDLGVACER